MERRLKLWVVATVACVLLGFVGLVLLVGSRARATPAKDNESLRVLVLQVHEEDAIANDSVRWVEELRDGSSDDGSSGSDDADEEPTPPERFSEFDADESDEGDSSWADSDRSDYPLGSDEASANDSAEDGALKEYILAANKAANGVSTCGAAQPFQINCFRKFRAGQEQTLQRQAQAVGKLVVDNGAVSCSGVLLGNRRSTPYFLTAAHCIRNEKDIGSAAIHFSGCSGPKYYTGSKVYVVNHRLNYAILKMNAGGEDIVSLYGSLRLRPSKRVFGEAVFIPHISKTGSKSLTTRSNHGPIMVQPFKGVRGCDVESAQSRLSYAAPGMNAEAAGAPVISLADGSIVALHLCGDCTSGSLNNALVSHSIIVDLENRGSMIQDFEWRPNQGGH